MNGISTYVLGTVIAAFALGAYLFSWNLFGYNAAEIKYIRDRVDKIYTMMIQDRV